MKRIITICALTLTAAIAASSLAVAGEKPPKPESAKDAAAKQCAAEKKADKAAFKSLYGKHAMRACIKGETPESATELKNAAKECKAARADDADRHSLRPRARVRTLSASAFPAAVKANDKADATEFKNAAKECKAARSDDAGAFAEAWGDKKNALGKCVSATVKADDTSV